MSITVIVILIYHHHKPIDHILSYKQTDSHSEVSSALAPNVVLENFLVSVGPSKKILG
jgi:hypothetical protein